MSPNAPRTTTVPGELRALVERLIVAWRDAPVLEIAGTAALQREGAAQRTLVNLTALGIDIARTISGRGSPRWTSWRRPPQPR